MDSRYIAMGITLVNIITLSISVFLVVFCYRKCYILKIPSKDHAFYQLKLKKCIAFFIFNGIAMYVNHRMFFDLGMLFPVDLMFLRYADRATCLIYAFLKLLDCMKYHPSAYENNKL